MRAKSKWRRCSTTTSTAALRGRSLYPFMCCLRSSRKSNSNEIENPKMCISGPQTCTFRVEIMAELFLYYAP